MERRDLFPLNKFSNIAVVVSSNLGNSEEEGCKIEQTNEVVYSRNYNDTPSNF